MAERILLFLVLTGLIVSVCYGSVGTQCLLEDITVQKDFDINKYLGLWHELYYYPKTYYTPNDYWQDVTYNYTLQNGGNISIGMRGRKPNDIDNCFNSTYHLQPTNVPGKYEYVSSSGRTFWVIATDYTEYAVTYGCRKEDGSGGCNATDNRVDTWIWGRNLTLSDAALEKAKMALPQLCVNFTVLFKPPQSEGCYGEINAGDRARALSWLPTTVFVIMMMYLMDQTGACAC